MTPGSSLFSVVACVWLLLRLAFAGVWQVRRPGSTQFLLVASASAIPGFATLCALGWVGIAGLNLDVV